VLLAIELLLFEYRARSVIPVALATSTAAALRIAMLGAAPVFSMPELRWPSGSALAFYIAVGAIAGLAAVLITRGLYALEDGFARLPLHWMWWPALGSIVVGVVGYFVPRTLGVGYTNIEDILAGRVVGAAALVLCGAKLVSWIVALASGTSGGTLAPLFTLGGGLGALLGGVASTLWPALGIDPRIAALVGMAAIFAGASRALLASVVFAFETTQQPIGLLPLLGGCTAAYMVSLLLMRDSIMTEKLARRGSPVPTELESDHLAQQLVRDHYTRALVALEASATVAACRAQVSGGAPGARFHGFPVVDEAGALLGVVTRRELLDPDTPLEAPVRSLVRRPAVVVFEDNTLREAADHMVHEGVGRLPVVARATPHVATGMLTRSDLLDAHATRLKKAHVRARAADRWK
jgi:CBS domain-containing protein